MNISFIVIAYNEEKNISKTVKSIQNQVDLTDHEIIIVNDGSKDNTVGVVNDLIKDDKKIKLVDLQPNRGRGAARVAGLAKAKGDYIAFIDADITLPKDWLNRCLKYMDKFDACGGTAVPDGDVSYINSVLDLKPKAASHTTTVTGSNGLFKKEVFDKVKFNAKKKNGEDVDLGYQFAESGLKATTAADVFVDHRETKTYLESVKWLFESGIGATRQFYEHREIRLPDLAFLGFAFLVLALIPFSIFLPGFAWLTLGVIILYITLSSIMHLSGKFKLSYKPLNSLKAILINDSILVSYYSGRLIGLFTQWRKL